MVQHPEPDNTPDKYILKEKGYAISYRLPASADSYQWDIQFDIISYLWSEIDNRARHILQDIGALFHTFGRSEQDILNLSSARRQIYLDMAYS